MTPADNEHNDRHIVQNVVKEIAGNTNVEAKSGRGFKVLVINEADRLSKEAQGGLRRTMEKYMKNCRMILLCTNLHRLISPIRSRCLNVRVPAPTPADIALVLGRLASTHQFPSSSEAVTSTVQGCDRNLRLAIIQLQASKFTRSPEGLLAPYKKEIAEVAGLIMKEQTPAQLKRVREKFYDLLVSCVEGQTILRELMRCLLKEEGLRQEAIKQVIHQAAEHERTLLCGSKAIFHL
jgi:replication factor C subunit 3/5